MKPVIGIPGNILTNFSPHYNSLPLTYTPQGFVDALHRSGALPVVFPLSTKENARQYVNSVDAILLAGGARCVTLVIRRRTSFKIGEHQSFTRRL
ncbi:gamma-glutamyl-gamma-aminobutyrate hydrolase family protein [Alkalibacterium sp. MB6]|uniref:gamma-glutamyl-gamma-aminobutyrate hydrolase family protein n=1 Tax=Alkalibacterium sp. MB6 TaxID=2081965 RepID=UPI001F2EC038|nr:gamma-glutamyl-gamma-aminobutyrate hydrolase family protein [Alkalibacterium sp. MB6]